MAYLLSPLAQRDLEGIWDYSAKTWGIKQAQLYIRQIEACLIELNSSPHRARECDDIRVGYRKYPIGEHMLFLKIISEDIHIIRILHSRMDFNRHF
jgi:toxin ParE1/3/4